MAGGRELFRWELGWLAARPFPAGRFPAGPQTSRADAGSEGQVVVLGVERLGEVLEGLLALGRRAGGGSGADLPGRRERLRAITATRQHDELTGGDLGGVPGLAFAVLPGAILDAPLDVDLVALLAVPLGDVGEVGALVVPQHHAVPLGFFLLFAGLVFPLAAGGD